MKYDQPFRLLLRHASTLCCYSGRKAIEEDLTASNALDLLAIPMVHLSILTVAFNYFEHDHAIQ